LSFMAQNQGLVIVSNRLPVSIEKQNDRLVAKRSIGGVATSLGAVAKSYHSKWVGWTGRQGLLPAQDLQQALGDDLVPVQAGSKLFRGYYDKFSNSLLWPVLHGVEPTSPVTETDWRDYCTVNKRFAASTLSTAKPDDLIWIHDYHLMMLPHFIRQTGAANRLGLFLHVPVPPAENLIKLPHLDDLLDSLSQLDLLGVQTVRDANNLKQLLLNTGRKTFCRTEVFPIGINYDSYHNSAALPAAQDLATQYRKSVGDKRVLFSLSRLDYTKGLIVQLQAVEQFMTTVANPEKFVYKLVVAPSREQIHEYRQLKDTIERTVHDINQRLGNGHWQPIDHTYQNLGFEEVEAWYQLADVLLLLPSMDGMNLIAKEYVASRQGTKGVLILSTGAGASFQLRDALLVPPHNVQVAANALARAVGMPAKEQADRLGRMRTVLRSQDISWWAERFVQSLGRS
jgi:trehalose 6-phosphate synthase/phosphatase